jgi:hypothetical protein
MFSWYKAKTADKYKKLGDEDSEGLIKAEKKAEKEKKQKEELEKEERKKEQEKLRKEKEEKEKKRNLMEFTNQHDNV